MALKVKNHKVLMSLLAVPYHGKLIEIIAWCSIRYHELVITCGFRAGDKGVHGTRPYCRGIDIRSWIYDDPQKIVNDINNHFEYDPTRPTHIVDGVEEPLQCAKLHDVYGEHIHLQAHPRTVYHKKGRTP